MLSGECRSTLCSAAHPDPNRDTTLGISRLSPVAANVKAEAIRVGDLHPLEALITGQLQLDGDLGLILQLQAVAMTLSMTTGGVSR